MSMIDDARLQAANAYTPSEHSAALTSAMLAIAEELHTANLIAIMSNTYEIRGDHPLHDQIVTRLGLREETK
jgi:hypothetical protein